MRVMTVGDQRRNKKGGTRINEKDRFEFKVVKEKKKERKKE